VRRIWPLLALAALALLLPNAALGSPAWLAPEQISDVPHDGRQPAVAMAPDGTVIVAYVKRPHITGPAPVRGTENEVVVRERPPGGSFGAEQVVDAGAVLNTPQLAIDPSGRAVLAWLNGNSVSTAVAPPGGGFGDILRYPDEGTSVDNFHLAVDHTGAASLIWRDFGDNALRTGFRPVSGPLAPAQTLDSPQTGSGITDHIQQLAFAEGMSGDVYAIWLHEVFDSNTSTGTSTLDGAHGSGGTYGPLQQLQSVNSSADDLGSPAVAVDSAGNALLSWTRGFSTTSLEARFWPQAASAPDSIEHPSAVSGVGANPGSSALAFDSLGSAVVGFRTGGVTGAIQYTTRSPGGAYAPAATLDSGASLGNLHLAAGSGGEIAATWFKGGGAAGAIKPAGAGFSAAHQLTTANVQDPAIASVDPQGNAAATWSQMDSGIPHVYVAGYDGTGPLIQGLSAPDNGVTGVPVAASFAAFDVWSLASTSINFGDGSAAVPGTSASHTYSKPGTYVIAPSAVDGVGTVSSLAHSIRIVSFLGSFGMTNRTFAVGKARTPVSAVKRGTTFKFTLGTPATVRIKIALKRRGVRVGKRCRAPSPKLTKGRHRKPCTFFQTKGTLTRHNQSGNVRVPFSGRIGRKALKPGSYRATATATDSAGHKSANGVVNFRIVLGRRGS
jgi:hypothetical protein